MKLRKYLIGIWVAIAVYSLFSFLGGPKGMSAYNYLLAERERQWNNITNLGIINEELEKTANNLLYDHDTLLIHARQMGYGHYDERFVRIVGLGIARTAPVTAGNVYYAQSPLFVSNRAIKITALCLGLLLFAFLFMLEYIESRSR
jgi:hypothetical protein